MDLSVCQDHSVTSRFVDSLYNTESTGGRREFGTLVLPVVAVTYLRPVAGPLNIGARVRYRYQGKAETLMSGGFGDTMPPPESNYDVPPFVYDLGGFDFSVAVGVGFGNGRREY